MEKTIRVLNKTLNAVVAGTLIALVLLVFSNVVLRYFFRTGITWTVEVSGLLFVWLVFLGAIIALKDHAHLGIDSFVGKLPLNAQKAMFTLVNSIIIAVMVLFADGVIGAMALNGSMTGSATPIPVNVMYAAGLAGAVLMILICIAQIIDFVFFGKGGPAWSTADRKHDGEAHAE
ncbi:TRAP transporter small permease [Arthrobacter subterraneus]|uniref:TRAP transporter small permease n=1 Tax=Arthrobacter subterraneus TaxID=335973 RepID=UPI003826DD12